MGSKSDNSSDAEEDLAIISVSSPEMEEDNSIHSGQGLQIQLEDDGSDTSISITGKPRDVIGISVDSIDVVSLKGGDSPIAGDAPHPKIVQGPSKQAPKLPWLESKSERTGHVSASTPDGFSMDASFSTMNFDTASIKTDDASMKSLDPAENVVTINSAEEIEESIAEEGIKLVIEVNDDDKSLGEMSEISMSNQSYILDLAGQKESRESHLKEECLGEAVALYKEAKKDGHRGRAFFLMVLTEVRKNKLESKAKYYKLQDERLDMALDEELQRRDRIAAGISAVTVQSVGHGRRSERVDDFIEREKKRKTLLSTPSTREDIILAASDVKFEMSDDGDYDDEWGEIDDSDASAEEKKTKERKKKKATKRSKKSKEGRTGTWKPKKKKSNASSTGKSKSSASGDEEKKRKKLTKKKSRKTDKPRKSSEPSATSSDLADSNASSTKEKGKKTKSKSPKVSELSATPPGDDAKDSSPKERKTKKSKGTKRTKKVKEVGRKAVEKNESPASTTSNTETSEANHVPQTESKPVTSQSPQTARHSDTAKMNANEPISDLVPSGNDLNGGDKPKKPAPKQRLGREAAKANKPQPVRRISAIFNTVLGRNKEPAVTNETTKKGGLFRRRKSQEESSDPGDRLLPLPRSELVPT